MDRIKYKKAERLRNEIRELKLLQSNLEGNSEIWLNTTKNSSFDHRITPDMKKTLLKMCIGEISTLEKEFDEL